MITQDIRRAQSVTGHLLAAVGRAFLKIVGFFLLFGVIGAGAVEGVAFGTTQHVPSTLTHITAAVFGVVLGYAAGLTTAVVEAIRGLIEAGKEGVKEAEKVEQTVTGDIGNVVKGIEGEIGKR
ncbi:MAG TPA: hypothetical protein VKB76_12915 [Ktedonobacterales bacterium]|nr:hypothetical protein [Ktedonobacterales bacterium]